MTLKFEVYVAPQIDVNYNITLPITGAVKWSPISSTLIYGENEAILVDTPITFEQNEELIEWVLSKLGNRQLTRIYITHGHADHFLGISLFKKRFPGIQAVATLGTVEHMKQQLEPAIWDARWAVYFPGKVPEKADVEMAEPLTGSIIYVDGYEVKVIELGQTDTHSSTALWAPDLELAVCGDCVYGEVHQMLGEVATPEKRKQWIKAIETIKTLNPKWVVAGHKRPDGEDSPRFLNTTIQYLLDFEEIVRGKPESSYILFEKMMEKHGERLNPAALEVGCHAVIAQVNEKEA
ncbi:beta-lactamase-like protein [Penicillium taxi]|uniref:beta-lactamase-like protein n=1 Tax=Penicillium taxi TaxID=168475 RepID=UPI0025453032|nr:beta-lactamase-like protein [Penicillium taxi]KAJ5899657.1 beta-lactamase-like protein [Penicillium taxi]